MLNSEISRSSYEGASAAHPLSFSTTKKGKKKGISMIQGSNKSQKHTKLVKNQLGTLHRR